MLPVPIRCLNTRRDRKTFDRSIPETGKYNGITVQYRTNGVISSRTYNFTSCRTCMTMYQHKYSQNDGAQLENSGVELDLQITEEIMNNNNLTMESMEDDEEMDSASHVSSWLHQVMFKCVT